MNVGIWGENPLREALSEALRRAGHTVSVESNALEDVAGLVVLPPADLEGATRGTYELLSRAVSLGVERVVLVSTLGFFSRLPVNWNLTTRWRPRPGTRTLELCPWLAELSTREITRSSRLHTHCLRVGDNISVENVVDSIIKSLVQPLSAEKCHDWVVEHVGDIPARPIADTRRWQDVLAPLDPIPSRPIRRIVIFGAGGPLGAALAQELAPHYQLRLTDVRDIGEVAREGKPFGVGAPLPVPASLLPASRYGEHESQVVDVRDIVQVRNACADMDAIVNSTVVRRDPVDAFRVNTVGAYNVAAAAVEHRIRRLVQTGPELLSLHNEEDYSWDYEVAGDAPSRPGTHLYGHSKFLGQEVIRVFAEWHGLEVPNLLFSKFANPKISKSFYPMLVSWEDAARALRCALEVPSLPSPYEEFHVTIPLPHGRFRNDKLKYLLGWEAQDGLESLWQTREDSALKP